MASSCDLRVYFLLITYVKQILSQARNMNRINCIPWLTCSGALKSFMNNLRITLFFFGHGPQWLFMTLHVRMFPNQPWINPARFHNLIIELQINPLLFGCLDHAPACRLLRNQRHLDLWPAVENSIHQAFMSGYSKTPKTSRHPGKYYGETKSDHWSRQPEQKVRFIYRCW